MPACLWLMPEYLMGDSHGNHPVLPRSSHVFPGCPPQSVTQSPHDTIDMSAKGSEEKLNSSFTAKDLPNKEFLIEYF